MSAGARSYSFMMLKNAHECTRIYKNALECTRIHQGPHILTQEKPSGLKAKLTWTSMGWTGCGRAIRRANGAPMCHYMSSKSSSSDSSPSPSSSTVSSVGWMRVQQLCCVQQEPRNRGAIRHRARDQDGLPVRLHHEAVQAGLDVFLQQQT